MMPSVGASAIPSICLHVAQQGREPQAFKETKRLPDRYPLTAEQRRTVLERDWLGMLRSAGNIYYTIKIAFCDGLTFQMSPA